MPSSVTLTSATLTRLAVLAVSAIVVTWLVSVTPVGAWLAPVDGA